MKTLFDGEFNGMPRSEMYRAEVFPELFPHEKPMRLSNWPQQDLDMYVGGEHAKRLAV